MAATVAPPGTWLGSAGARSPRTEAVLRLHKLHFVEKRGSDGVKEAVETRRRENNKFDAKQTRAHLQRMQELQDARDERWRLSKLHGSLSRRSKAAHDAMEEARLDPNEATEKKVKEMREVARGYQAERQVILSRVGEQPNKTVRSKEETLAWEDARQDPKEAKEKSEKHMREMTRSFKESKQQMVNRVSQLPKCSFRTRAERDRIEEIRQDPDEAAAKMTKHMQELAKTFRTAKKEMSDRVQAAPPVSLRSKEELKAWEDARQDPTEAQEAIKKQVQEQARLYKQEKDGIFSRVGTQPKKTFWTPEQRKNIEDRRQDPDEAKAKMIEHMRNLSNSFKEQKQIMHEKVNNIPAMTFRSKIERDMHDAVKGGQSSARSVK